MLDSLLLIMIAN